MISLQFKLSWDLTFIYDLFRLRTYRLRDVFISFVCSLGISIDDPEANLFVVQEVLK